MKLNILPNRLKAALHLMTFNEIKGNQKGLKMIN